MRFTDFPKQGLLFIFALSLAFLLAGCNVLSDVIPGTSHPQAEGQQPAATSDTENPKEREQPYVPGGDIAGSATVDFTYVNDGNLSVTVNAILLNCSSTNVKYTWSTADDWLEGQSQTLTFALPGTYDITLYVVIDGDSENYRTVVKEVQVTSSATKAQPINLFQFAQGENHPDRNPGYMYFALRLKGESAGGCFRQDANKNGGFTHAYPRAVEYAHSSGQYSGFDSKATPYLASLNVGYTDETGFADEAGTAFDMPFYFGDNNFRVKMNGKQGLGYTFENLALLDRTVDHVLGGYPCFVRINKSEAFTVTIPMDSYDASKHKNIAKLTVHITNEGKSPYKYTVSFDGFESK